MKRFAILILVVVAALGGGTAVWLIGQGGPVPTPVVVPPSASSEPDAGSAPDPLSREAMAARSYPGGALTVVEELGDRGGFRSQVVSYPSDGHTVRALLNLPTTAAPPGGRPVVVFNHGYIPPKQYRTTGSDYQLWVEGLTRAGYIVVKPDYRGHDQSSGPAVGGNWAPDYTYDVLNLVSSLKRYPGVNPGRIGMVGHSMGGGITVRAAAVSPDIRAAVTLAGVIGTADDLYYRWRQGPRPTPSPGMFGSARQELTARYGPPQDNPEAWAPLAPTGGVASLSGPVQVHHSADDAEVPKLFSDSYVAVARQAGQGVEYFEYPSGGHQFSSTGGLVLQRMIAFFAATLR